MSGAVGVLEVWRTDAGWEPLCCWYRRGGGAVIGILVVGRTRLGSETRHYLLEIDVRCEASVN